MSHRSTNIRRLARTIAIVLGSAGLPSLAIGFGCGNDVTYPAPSGPPNDHITTGGMAGTGDGGPTIDLCACAVELATDACTTCNEKVAGSGMSCGTAQANCANSTTCPIDAQCIGACVTDAASPEPACVYACIQAAGKEYLTYLSCICHHCSSTCTSQSNCPGP